MWLVERVKCPFPLHRPENAVKFHSRGIHVTVSFLAVTFFVAAAIRCATAVKLEGCEPSVVPARCTVGVGEHVCEFAAMGTGPATEEQNNLQSGGMGGKRTHSPDHQVISAH